MNEVMDHNEEIDVLQTYTANDFCRLCANIDDNLVSIFADEGVDHMLEDKIRTHLPFLNISENDVLPKRICYQCASAVLVWSELYVCSADADQKLRSMFEVASFEQNDCKTGSYNDIDIDVPVKNFIGDSIEYDDMNNVNMFHKPEKSDKTLNELDKIPSTSKNDNMLNHQLKSSVNSGDETLNSGMKREMASMFGGDDEDDSEDNMYLNAAGIDDDINGLMNCHRLDMSSVDDCGVLVEPKQEYLDEPEMGMVHPKIEMEDNDQDQDNGCIGGIVDDEHHLDHHHERLRNGGDDNEEVDDNGSSLNATIPGITTITDDDGDGHLMDDDDEDEDDEDGDYKPQLVEMRDEDLRNGGLVDGRGSSNGDGETINNADVRELYMNTTDDGSGTGDGEQQETMCQLCATVFKTRYNLLRHFQKRHPEYKMYECDLCRISFPSIDEFKDHLEEKHSKVHTTHAMDSKQVRFACDVCGNMYKNKASAMNHLLTHTAKKSVRCDHCDFTCYTKQQLGVHQTKHDKRFVCEICHKRFAQKSQLDVHVNAVHYNQRPFACVLCKKTFKTKGSHDAHMIVHTDTRNYQCPHCDKKCRKRYDLTLHIRTHTGEKPFKCSVCGRGFVQMCDTRKHEMLHFKPGKRKSFFFSSPEPEENVLDDE